MNIEEKKKVRSYSNDLRKKVIDYIESGNSQRSAAFRFKISATSVNIWWRRYREEGNYQAKKNPGAKPKVDIVKLEEYCLKNPSTRLIDIGKEFGITDVGALYWLRKLGYSYKKNFYLQGS